MLTIHLFRGFSIDPLEKIKVMFLKYGGGEKQSLGNSSVWFSKAMKLVSFERDEDKFGLVTLFSSFLDGVVCFLGGAVSEISCTELDLEKVFGSNPWVVFSRPIA